MVGCHKKDFIEFVYIKVNINYRINILFSPVIEEVDGFTSKILSILLKHKLIFKISININVQECMYSFTRTSTSDNVCLSFLFVLFTLILFAFLTSYLIDINLPQNI